MGKKKPKSIFDRDYTADQTITKSRKEYGTEAKACEPVEPEE